MQTTKTFVVGLGKHRTYLHPNLRRSLKSVGINLPRTPFRVKIKLDESSVYLVGPNYPIDKDAFKQRVALDLIRFQNRITVIIPKDRICKLPRDWIGRRISFTVRRIT